MSAMEVSIGPRQWREASVKTVKVAQALCEDGADARHTARLYDPLPSGRDVLALQSNQRAHEHIRQTRDVVTKLHRLLLEVSDEIRSATRCKESLEKKLDHCRKDMHLNRQSAVIRQDRPKREREYDGADSLIESEYLQLQELKAQLEVHLHSVKEQLHELHEARLRILANIQERSQVLPLTCMHGFDVGARTGDRAMSRSGPGPHSRAASAPAVSFRQASRDATRPSGSSSSSRGSRTPQRSGSATARARPSHERSVTFAGMDVPSIMPCTDEVAVSLSAAAASMKESRMLRQQASRLAGNVTAVQQAGLHAVNDGLAQKMAETLTLKKHLMLSGAETRRSINKTRRWLDHQELTQGYTMGPVSYNDLATRERLDRPLIRAYQGHPGTDLPEARELVRNSHIMEQSMRQTKRSLGVLRLAKDKLDADRCDKHAAAAVDGEVLRLRRRRGDHRWVQSRPTPRPVTSSGGVTGRDIASFAHGQV